MKIIEKYILRESQKNTILTIGALTLLFWFFDLLDRIDNIVVENPPIISVVSYFLLKIPHFCSTTIAPSVLIGLTFTITLMNKNKELIALRSAGIPIFQILKPMYYVAMGTTLLVVTINEFITPITMRKAKEIYNIDIKQKDKRGTYSQEYIWWRENNKIYLVEFFDSRKKELVDFSEFKIDIESYMPQQRTLAKRSIWLGEMLRWNLKDVTSIYFDENGNIIRKENFISLPFLSKKNPSDFFKLDAEPETMSFLELKKFIQEQRTSGVNTATLLPDLYAKLALPFSILIIPLVALPFATKHQRNYVIGKPFLISFIVAAGYYFIHSISLSFGRAEILSPIISAWLANFILFIIGIKVSISAEKPS